MWDVQEAVQMPFLGNSDTGEGDDVSQRKGIGVDPEHLSERASYL